LQLILKMTVIEITEKMGSGETGLKAKRNELLAAHGGHRLMVINAPEFKHYSCQVQRTVFAA
jgi:hypothetical protein